MRKNKSGITTEEVDIYNAMSTCIRNGIIIYPVVYRANDVKGQKNPKCQIEVNARGRCLTFPDIYKQDNKLYETIEQLYIKYYNDYFN